MAPLRAEQRQADPRLEAIVRVDEDRLAGPEEPRLLDRGMPGRAVDVVRRLRGEGRHDQDDVAEGLRKGRRPLEHRSAGAPRLSRVGERSEGLSDRLPDLVDLRRRRGILIVRRRAVGDQHVQGEVREVPRDLRGQVAPADVSHGARMDRRGDEEGLEAGADAEGQAADSDAGGDADRVEEGLELRDAGRLRFRVVIERGTQELQPVHAERAEERSLRDLRVGDRAEEEQRVHGEGQDHLVRPEGDEQGESGETEQGVQGGGGEGPQVPRVRGRGQDDLADPEDGPVSQDRHAVDPAQEGTVEGNRVDRQDDHRDELERPEQDQADERKQERTAEIHAAAEPVRQRDRAERGQVGGDRDGGAAEQDAAPVERWIDEEIGLHEREGDDRQDDPLRGRGDEEAPRNPGRLRSALARRLGADDVHLSPPSRSR